MAKAYPPIRALIIRELVSQKTAYDIKRKLTPQAENSKSIARLLQQFCASGIAMQIDVPRRKQTDAQHAYVLSVSLDQALAADRAAIDARNPPKLKLKTTPKAKAAKPKADPAVGSEMHGVPPGAIKSNVIGGGVCYTLGNHRVFKLENAKRKMSNDCIGSKVKVGNGFASCLLELAI